MDFDHIDEFCSGYLKVWNKRATLRSLERYRVNNKEELGSVYPITKQPLAGHPAVKAMGAESVDKLLTLNAYQVMLAVAGIEVVVVNQICSNFATFDYSFDIPPQARQVALTIAADESYHAFVAKEFIADVSRLTGIEPMSFEKEEVDAIPLVMAIKQFKANVDSEIAPTAELIALCFAENFLTEDLYDLSRESDKDSVFQRIIREHIMDEGRHQQFFKNLLTYLWSQLDDQTRCQIGKALPQFLDLFLMDLQGLASRDEELLQLIGIDDARERRTILNEVYNTSLPPWHGYKGGFPHTKPSYQLLIESGIVEHEPTRQALIKSNWILQQRPVTAEGV